MPFMPLGLQPENNSLVDENRNRFGWIGFRTVVVGLVALTFVFLMSLTLTRFHTTQTHPYRAMELEGDWIRAPGDEVASGYFRKRFDINSSIRHAWITVAAQEGFEVTVNRNPIGRIYLWRPTRPYKNGSSESGQALSSDKPAMALNFPREYQWDGHQNWLLPTFLDITNDVRQGKNVICIEVESRAAPAAVSFHGEIELYNGEVIPIHSDASWKAEPVPIGPQLVDWTEPSYWDKQWRHAANTNGPQQTVYRSLPSEIYAEPFGGQWTNANRLSTTSTKNFYTNWNIEDPIDEAWLRLIGNRKFELFVNDTRVAVEDKHSGEADTGDWVLGRESALDPIATPEILDPDESAGFFLGKKFENPRDAQANLREFKNLKIKTHLPFRNYKTTNRAEEGGEFDPTRTLAESRRTPEKPDLPAENPIPTSLKRDRAMGGYFAYSVGKLLKVGDNKIEIRPVETEKLNWRPSFAMDGGARLGTGQSVAFPAAKHWRTESSDGTTEPVEVGALVAQPRQAMPRLNYRGIALQSPQSSQAFSQVFLKTFLLTGLVLLLFWNVASFLRAKQLSSTLVLMMISATVVLLCGSLLENSFRERHEILWFSRGTGWLLVLVSTAVVAAAVGLINPIGQFKRPAMLGAGFMSSIRSLPNTRLWPHMIIWVLLLCALLRGYKLDMQPLDDDEYASTQAIAAIIETGVPNFVPEGIYYTRSPLFHYVTAAVAWPFGGNLWSLRLQSVFWSVATAFLVYLCGSRLLNNRWIGFAAMVLISIHPFQVFTGHVIRFYQMQQFFALLTVYLFCRGFVAEQNQRYRIATIVVFLCAVLSQEISAVMAVPLLLGYVLFARDLGWRRNTQLLIISAAAILIIGLDLVAFKTLCLTRTEGVSPNVEASIKPHFWYPLNLFAVFVGYSRLHIIPSFFCFLGLPLFWREKNRNGLALAMFLFSGVVMTNLLVSHISLRYQYWLFPIWILVSLHAIQLISTFVVESAASQLDCRRWVKRNALTPGVLTLVVICSIVISWAPWRTVGTYEMRILGDSTGCVRWVKSQMRSGDKLAITEPHTHAAHIESGNVDYDIAVPLLYDFAVFQDGRLIDRNGGGEIVSNVDEFISVIEKQDRVWVLINREKFRTRGKNLRWEYPGARFEMFLRKNCELKHRTYLWHAYLWDASRGHYISFNQQN